MLPAITEVVRVVDDGVARFEHIAQARSKKGAHFSRRPDICTQFELWAGPGQPNLAPRSSPGSIIINLLDHQPDGEEVPRFVEGILEALRAIEEAQFHHIRGEKIEPGIPPARQMPVLEPLARRKLIPRDLTPLLQEKKASRFPSRVVHVTVEKLVDAAEIVVFDG